MDTNNTATNPELDVIDEAPDNVIEHEKKSSSAYNPFKMQGDRLEKMIRMTSVVLIIFYPIIATFFARSGDNVNIMASELAFSAETLRNEYTFILLNGSMVNYRIAQGLDYGFMILYSTLIALITARWYRIGVVKLGESAPLVKMGKPLPTLSIVALACDAMENLFIFLMLSTSPTFDFAASWAIIHSTFSLVKWIIIFVAIGWWITVRIKIR